MNQGFWRKCIVCKSEIAFSTKYYKCSVNSCDKKRAPAQFCSVECWDVHRSIMSHKSAGADEYQSPSYSEGKTLSNQESRVRMISRKEKKIASHSLNIPSGDEILVVASKLKSHVKEIHGFNTSADVMPVLSELIRKTCNEAIQNAQKEGRKTLMARDF